MSSSTSHGQTGPSRELFKGRLQKPTQSPVQRSYTTSPARVHELIVKTTSQRQEAREPEEIHPTAVPQPFLDPGWLERRKREQKNA
ncbi:hypothetical protein KJ359_006407 [Pestalotiopsis sp. 9143b]|nr:hypothetical protein KJ359_006407 [Pestalotiopsis sp. 9143b]